MCSIVQFQFFENFDNPVSIQYWTQKLKSKINESGHFPTHVVLANKQFKIVYHPHSKFPHFKELKQEKIFTKNDPDPLVMYDKENNDLVFCEFDYSTLKLDSDPNILHIFVNTVHSHPLCGVWYLNDEKDRHLILGCDKPSNPSIELGNKRIGSICSMGSGYF